MRTQTCWISHILKTIKYPLEYHDLLQLPPSSVVVSAILLLRIVYTPWLLWPRLPFPHKSTRNGINLTLKPPTKPLSLKSKLSTCQIQWQNIFLTLASFSVLDLLKFPYSWKTLALAPCTPCICLASLLPQGQLHLGFFAGSFSSFWNDFLSSLFPFIIVTLICYHFTYYLTDVGFISLGFTSF